MTLSSKAALALFITSVLFGVALLFAGSYANPALGSAPSGNNSVIASSSIPITVGSTSPVTLFSVSGLCTARVITTYQVPVMLSFSTSSADALRNKPTATYGHLQAASTTVVYDSGLYGCPEVTAYGFQQSVTVPSTTITISEFK